MPLRFRAQMAESARYRLNCRSSRRTSARQTWTILSASSRSGWKMSIDTCAPSADPRQRTASPAQARRPPERNAEPAVAAAMAIMRRRVRFAGAIGSLVS